MRAKAGAHLARRWGIGLAAGAGADPAACAGLCGGLSAAPASAEVETLAWQYLGIRIWGRAGDHRALRRHRLADRIERTRSGAGAATGDERAERGAGSCGSCWGWDGVPGVALATLIAEWSGLALGWFAPAMRCCAVPRGGGLWARDRLISWRG